jgi:hypothetical protein
LVAISRILDVFPSTSRTNGHKVIKRAVLGLAHRSGLGISIDRASDNMNSVSNDDKDRDKELSLGMPCLIAPQI